MEGWKDGSFDDRYGPGGLRSLAAGEVALGLVSSTVALFARAFFSRPVRNAVLSRLIRNG